MDLICKLCDKKIGTYKGLGLHIVKFHKMEVKDYYDKYIKSENEGKCLKCKNQTNFISLKDGYRNYCSTVCSNDPEIMKELVKKGIVKKHGVKNVPKSKEVKDKQIQIEKCEVDNSSKTKEKIKQTDLKKCVVTKTIQPVKIKDKVQPIINSSINIIPQQPKVKIDVKKEITDFCKLYNPNLIENDRNLISPLELDIYIPQLNLAIEFNGLYAHSEQQGKDKQYHLNKYKLCKEKGVQLVQIFEDEWIDKKDIVTSILLNKFGKIQNRIFARKCIAKEIDHNTAKDFLVKNHIQRSTNVVGKHFGLYYKDELYSVLSMGKPRYNKHYDWEVLRFCSRTHSSVAGGLGKLFSYFIKKYNPSNIMTYVDIRYGNGNSYKKIGFTETHVSDPNYFYIIDMGRESRVKYQKHKLKNVLKTFDPTLTEYQNMLENGIDRIWDCGNLVLDYKL